MSDHVQIHAEPVQIGINEAAHYKLEQLCNDRIFAEMRDGYRFAVAYALSRQVDPPRAEGARKNVFSISTIDPDGLLKLAIDIIHPSKGEAAYKTAERLVDWGITEVDRLIREEFQTVKDLLPD